MNAIRLSDNIFKLPDRGIYVTSIDSRIYYSPMTGLGRPALDQDGCIEWFQMDCHNQEIQDLFGGKKDVIRVQMQKV
jgi:hypothetical protein